MKAVVVGLLGMAVAGTALAGKPLTVTAEGVALYKVPDGRQVVRVLPGVFPGSVLIRQEIVVPQDPGMGSVCFYLVKGYSDTGREALEALKPENVLQMNCQTRVVDR